MRDEHEVILDIIDDEFTENFKRLADLKRLKAEIEEQITDINTAIIETYPAGGLYVDHEGREVTVTIRRDLNAPKVDLALLQEIDTELAGKVTKFAVDTEKVKEYIERGYFTGTPAEQALTLTYKKPWVQLTARKEETVE
jgi:hypothetical protein